MYEYPNKHVMEVAPLTTSHTSAEVPMLMQKQFFVSPTAL